MSRRSPAANRQLWILAGALVLAMSPWFSTAAVLGDLRVRWELSSAQASWLTIVVQLGFVAGAVVSATTNLADRVAPRRLVALGAAVAALANAGVVVADSFGGALVARGLTGAALAAVYPPALKAMSSWFAKDRGFALGVMIGALTLGSALPHLVNASADVSWQAVLLTVSGLTVVGGAIAELVARDGPHATSTASFDPSQLRAIVANRSFRLATAGYFGHMWELYAMWAWITAFYGDVVRRRQRALGQPRCASPCHRAPAPPGRSTPASISDRIDRGAKPQRIALRWSGSAALVVMGFLLDAPTSDRRSASVWFGGSGWWRTARSSRRSSPR